MRFLHDYIQQLRDSGKPSSIELAEILDSTRSSFDIHSGGDPQTSFDEFVSMYNWLGQSENKEKYGITRNFARNLPGSLMQDFLLHLTIQVSQPFPQLDIFTEVRVPFGSYPLWTQGRIIKESPSERSDISIGYLLQDSEVVHSGIPWPKQPFYRLERNQSVMPLVTINSKIRVSQSEFFDWLGREQLMTKGNPHCLSVQVALRKEMDLSIVEAAQAGDKFFLLGEGTERNVDPNRDELSRLIEVISSHLEERMI